MIRLFIIVCLVSLSFVSSMAQNKHYLYIHNVSNQQFNLKLDHRIYVSDESGNLIIPKLEEGVIQFSIIPTQTLNNYPSFEINLNQLNKGWDLVFDQSSAYLENWISKEKITPNSQYEQENWWNGAKKKDNGFAQMMSEVVADSAVLYNTNSIIPSVKYTEIAKVDPRLSKDALLDKTLNSSEKILVENNVSIDSLTAVLKDSTQHSLVQSAGSKDSVIAQTSKISMNEIKNDSLTENSLSHVEKINELKVVDSIKKTNDEVLVVKSSEEVQSKSDIIVQKIVEKKKDSITPDGRYIEYYIKDGDTSEIVDIIIPMSSNSTEKTIESKPIVSDAIPINEKQIVNDHTMVMYNSDCKTVATDSDIDKYRVRLLTMNQEQRLSQMGKYLKSKCITTKQIKALSELFPTDDDRYAFLELCYPYVEETTTFKLLIDLLDTPSNQTKFKQLTRIQF